MKLDRRKLKRPRKPLCTTEHVWGDFVLYGTCSSIKRCKNCPAILTKEEFLKNKVIPEIRLVHREIKNVKEYIDLFGV